MCIYIRTYVHTYIHTYVGEITIMPSKPLLLLRDKQTLTANTQHPSHSDILVYHPTGTYIHTSSSSFTLHLPPSRRDWTSCSLPSAAATSRSLTTEALDAACRDRSSIQIHVYSVGWDGIIYSSTNPRSITMYVLLPNENIDPANTLRRWTGIHMLCWGGSAHLTPWTINNYDTRKVPFVDELSSLYWTVWYASI